MVLEYHSNISRIKKIEFDFLNSKEIKDDSVVEITQTESFSNNEPVANGLFDSRMSGINKFDVCQTDSLPSNKSPGYFGNIELAVPVYNHNHMSTISNILSLVCINCGKLLVDHDQNIDHVKKTQLIDILSKKKKLMYLSAKKNNSEIICEFCNTPQPLKYSFDKSGIDSAVNLIVSDHYLSPFLPEFVSRLFKKITTETKKKMGMDNSNLENLIISTVPVCPPFLRPTVFMGDIRSEDHITLKYNELLKNNSTAQQLLLDKNNKYLESYRSVLHYDVNTLFDNNTNGLVGSKSKSGIEQITFGQRINGKTSKEGRIRGNLMSKRVEFSARTVISPDPCISCDEIGLPLAIAMELTISEKVTPKNYLYLTEHAKNGNKTYPGSKGIYKKTGLFYSTLTDGMKLDIGDRVVRHLRNGDYVIINRQPTLHKMSMMGHKVRIIKGSSLRLNVNVTEPYNADFDGDEMNLHCPQTIATQNEVKCIACVNKQCMSGASNEPAIIFIQDNVLSAYRLASDKTAFTGRELMNIVCQNDNYYIPGKMKETYSGEEMISHYMPPFIDISQYTKKGFHKKNVVKLIKSVWHESGNSKCFDMINHMQILFREYMMSKAFSISPKDLNCKQDIFKLLDDSVKECRDKINEDFMKVHKSSKKFKSKVLTVKDVFENTIFEKFDNLSKIVKDELVNSEESRLMEFINSKSKGKEKNIMQIKGFLGQQLVNGARVNNGFTDRTLPHFEKFSEDISSKGFVSSSFNKGLTATEYFFHSGGGRDGLIDQALQTGISGYLQYQMVKTLEDLIIDHNGIVKDANGKIVQFLYGSDGCTSENIEKQDLSHLSTMSFFELEITFCLHKNQKQWQQYLTESIKLSDKQIQKLENYYDELITIRSFMIDTALPNKPFENISHPVNIPEKIKKTTAKFNLSKSLTTNIDPITILRSYDVLFKKCENFTPKSNLLLFKFLLYTLASPKDLICKYRFTQEAFTDFILSVEKSFIFSRVERGEPVGVTAAQSIGEPSTQLVLNSFHAAGSGSNGGLPRILELMYKQKKQETASMQIHFISPHNIHKETAEEVLQQEIICKYVKEFIIGSNLYASKVIYNLPNSSISSSLVKYKQFITMMNEDISDYNWILSLKFNNKDMLENIWVKLNDVKQLSFIYIDDENKELVMMLNFTKSINETSIDKQYKDVMNEIDNLQISGVDGIGNVILKKTQEYYYDNLLGITQFRDVWIGISTGTNLMEILGNPAINNMKTYSDNIHDTIEVFGIEAARGLLRDELYKVLSGVADLDVRHVEILSDRLTQTGIYSSIQIEDMEALETEPLARASYMNVVNEFQKAALHGECDNINGLSSNIMVGQVPACGTGVVDINVDENILSTYSNKKHLNKLPETSKKLPEIYIKKRVKFDFDEFN